MECPVCMNQLSAPIYQCEGGHSLCKACTKEITKCPSCGKAMTKTRNYTLEHVVEDMKGNYKKNCTNVDKGCKYNVQLELLDKHEMECQYRTHFCVGAAFAKWNCTWLGDFNQILSHFTDKHNVKVIPLFKGDLSLIINLKLPLKDVRVISFFEGKQLFYYKSEVNTQKKKCYWTFQFVGPESEAKNYFYEFEIYDGSRKMKISEICRSDSIDTEDIYKSEKCVVMSFTQTASYLVDGVLKIRFRIMNLKGNELKPPKAESRPQHVSAATSPSHAPISWGGQRPSPFLPIPMQINSPLNMAVSAFQNQHIRAVHHRTQRVVDPEQATKRRNATKKTYRSRSVSSKNK